MKLGFAAAASLVLAGAGRAQVTQRVSVATGGAQGNGDCDWASLSADGRYVAFQSFADDLVPGDTNGFSDIFVHDRLQGTTELVSISTGGQQGNGNCYVPSISADGRYVAFSSSAHNLISGGTGWADQVFVRDRVAGTTELVSVSPGGTPGDNLSTDPYISTDGRYVLFDSLANNLVIGDTNQHEDVFLRDRQTGTTELVSISTSGGQGNATSGISAISADGRFVTFSSFADNLVPNDTNGAMDVFVRDRQNGTTERVSVDSGGGQGNNDSVSSSISADGRYVGFMSWADNLVPGDTNQMQDIFIHDLQSGVTERVSVATGGAQAQGWSGVYAPALSADGRYVAFESNAWNLVPGDNNRFLDIFVRDRLNGITERVSVSSTGAQSDEASLYPSMTPDGRYVGFVSLAGNLVSGDTNSQFDSFVHDRGAAGFTSLCEPGSGAVIACPCSNPPGGTNQGCDNSSATGGASLAASGVAYLSIDSLNFTTSGERSTALSILMQGDALLASGVAYGQGVRCVGGTLKRLFTKHAVAGSITAPDFAAGDPTVSARSAAQGDAIQPGQSRYYLVYYRDPVVLGGCPASATFNATQTGEVTWWP